MLYTNRVKHEILRCMYNLVYFYLKKKTLTVAPQLLKSCVFYPGNHGKPRKLKLFWPFHIWQHRTSKVRQQDGRNSFGGQTKQICVLWPLWQSGSEHVRCKYYPERIEDRKQPYPDGRTKTQGRTLLLFPCFLFAFCELIKIFIIKESAFVLCKNDSTQTW